MCENIEQYIAYCYGKFQYYYGTKDQYLSGKEKNDQNVLVKKTALQFEQIFMLCWV